jgi:hypothetical protein
VTPRPLLLAAALTLAAAGRAGSCGFEDPSSVTFQRGILNMAFPKALYVTSAVWKAQQAGLIADLERSPQERGRFGYVNTNLRLQLLGSRLENAGDGLPHPSFSMLLIGPMLWSQFALHDDSVAVMSHVAGPASDDVVIITDGAVVAAMLEGGISFSQARDAGLLRLYGTPDKVTALSDWFAALDLAMKETSPQPMLAN